MDDQRPTYDCDTSSYWCTEEQYHDRGGEFGRFVDGGRAFHVARHDTPRPWLNYLCNEKFASCVSNTGLGFTWFRTSLLRITRYGHEIDYLPREFRDGRAILVRDEDSGHSWQAFGGEARVECIHRPGLTTIWSEFDGVRTELRLFVPVTDSGECWGVTISNLSGRPRRLAVAFEQVWAFARFGIHTAEEGIPYLSTPGRGVAVSLGPRSVHAAVDTPELPCRLFGIFTSAEELEPATFDQAEERRDGRRFVFKLCRLSGHASLRPGDSTSWHLFAGADEAPGFPEEMGRKYSNPATFGEELERVLDEREAQEQRICCSLPDKNIEFFLNTWLKNQLHLTFRFVRSGFIGFRDTLQDTWGMVLLDPAMARRYLLRTLAHVRRDGVCPRNYSIIDQGHDLRAFMDSGSWIAMTLVDYVRETGDFTILDEPVPWLDSEQPSPALDHVCAALDLLYAKRGRHGLCLTGDGDWNDALEGIGKSGDAVSAWLTMALFHAQNLMALLFDRTGNTPGAQTMRARSDELARCLESAWDGDWYVYGFTATGAPIGSRTNREGRIHLNAQSWALFTGLADPGRATRIRRAVAEHLETPYGPALLAPPYADEAAGVGRIARLEPGTFENGSVYQHAVAFAIYAEFATGNGDAGADLFARLLPTNPENFDARRTSEPYCTGNYYCGPAHPRCGQNFFTWFTGNAAWLLRAGFDEMLGIHADFDGLRLSPCVPDHWDGFTARRTFRDQVYEFRYTRTNGTPHLVVDGERTEGMYIPARAGAAADPVVVQVYFGNRPGRD